MIFLLAHQLPHSSEFGVQPYLLGVLFSFLQNSSLQLLDRGILRMRNVEFFQNLKSAIESLSKKESSGLGEFLVFPPFSLLLLRCFQEPGDIRFIRECLFKIRKQSEGFL